jgi:hypothetical protein
MKAGCIFDFAVLSRDLDLSLSSLLPWLGQDIAEIDVLLENT